MKASWNDPKLIALIAILLLGCLIRVGGIMHGLPFSYYPDEQHFMNRAMSFGTGDLNPHWFHKPALYMYILFFEYGLFYLFGRLIGLFASMEQFASLYMNDKTIFLLIGRGSTLLFGMGMIFLTYRLGRKIFNQSVGLIAALILASNFSHVRSCQEIKADVPMAFFALASFVFMARIVEKGQWKDYVLAGLFMGLGTATKYAPMTLLAPAFLAHVMFLGSHRPMNWRKLIWGNFLLSFLFLLIGFFIGSPFNFLDPHWFRTEIVPTLLEKTSPGGASGGTPFSGLVRALWNPLHHIGGVILSDASLGALLGALSLVGVAYLIFRGKKSERLIAFTALSFMYASDIWFRSYTEARHLNIIYPFLSLGAAAVIYQVLKIPLVKRTKVLGIPPSLVVVIVPILLVLPSLYRIVRYDYIYTRQDSRTMAYHWVEENIPAGTKMLVDHYCVPLKMSAQRALDYFRKAELEAEKGPFTAHAAEFYRFYSQTIEEPTYEVQEISHPWWKKTEEEPGTFLLSSELDRDFGNPLKEWGVKSLEEYRALGYRYLITMDYIVNMYLSSSHGENFPSFVRFYRQVQEESRLVRQFEPYTPQGPGPKILVYEL